MCGRFAFFSPAEAITALFDVEFPLPLEPRYNITPGSFIITLRGDAQSTLEPAVLKWGLVPSWSKDPKIGNRLINARAETVAEKPSYRAAFKRRRCVILADGFYEWRPVGGGKVPYFITRGDRVPAALAGLWETWQGPDGEELETCTILTTAANELLSPIHARMPVILAPDAAQRWISGEADQREVAQQLLQSPENERLEFWPVSRAVNNPRNDAPDLIAASEGD